MTIILNQGLLPIVLAYELIPFYLIKYLQKKIIDFGDVSVSS